MVLTDRIHAIAEFHTMVRRDEIPKREDKASKRAVIHEWDNWAALHPDDLQDPNAETFFFTHLQEKKPQLLNFESSGDKWQTVYVWPAASNPTK